MSQNSVRRFEFNDGKSSKFWEIEIAGAQFAVHYGKIGTTGQAQTKEFADAAAAAKAADRLIAEKTGKGYQEVDGAPKAPIDQITSTKDSASVPANVVSSIKGSAMPKRSKRVEKQIAEAHNLVARINQYFQDDPSVDSDVIEVVHLHLQYFQETFGLKTKAAPPEKIDRLAGMLSGPLFTSDLHPRPLDKKARTFVPIAQFDLAVVNACCGTGFPIGLLQIWIDRDGKELIRLVPSGDVKTSQLTELDLKDIPENDDWIVPVEWSFPFSKEVLQIAGFTSEGMSCPEISDCLSNYDVPDDLLDLVAELEMAINVSPTHLFGKFRDFNVSVMERGVTDERCFLSVSDWGGPFAMGGAQLYYNPTDNGTNFAFRYSLK